MRPMTSDAASALQNAGFSRRNLLKGAGALIVGFSMGGGRKVDAQTQGAIPANQVDSWVAIAAESTVVRWKSTPSWAAIASCASLSSKRESLKPTPNACSRLTSREAIAAVTEESRPPLR